jgi:DNA-binding transcriptional LysR family regulator
MDFGFSRAPDTYPVGLKGFVVLKLPMLLALPRDHPLAALKSIDPKSLKGEVHQSGAGT